MKMAASEGLWETSGDPAPWTVIAAIDPENQTNHFEIKIPYLLSYLSYGTFSGSLKGMKELQAEYEQTYGPGDYIPPVRTTFWSFRIMVAAGTAMILLAAYGTWLALRKKLGQSHPRYMKMMLAAVALPFIGNTAGWIMTEVGRQPWTVFGLLTTEDAVSPGVGAGEVLFTLLAFSAVYLTVLGIMAWLFVRTARKGPELEEGADPLRRPSDETIDPYGMGGPGRVAAR
jgi:cytochrome d ubiquinol oxidase subunit I